mmetsp:Transcript_2596/g.3742  ORF Transcript_2596/g.3742 Transcript_2596/m.3742 type:complete len:917 (+) Transcript_2596:35-2785(+)
MDFSLYMASGSGVKGEDQLDKVMDKLKTYLLQKRVRVKDAFSDFDPLNSGYINKTQFQQACSMLNIQLTPTEIEIVTEEYYEPDRNQVCWRRFDDDITQVFTGTNMERNPRATLYSHEKTLQKSKDVNHFNDGTKTKRLNGVLRKLKYQCDIKGYILRNCFRDFDRHRHGVVTKAQFLKCLPFKNMKPADINLLIERYTNYDGDVNYEHFHNEVNKSTNQRTHSAQEQTAFAKVTSPLLSTNARVDDVERQLKRLIMRHRIRIDDGFRDYDPLNKGRVTRNQFYSVMGSIKFPKFQFTDQQLSELANRYEMTDPTGVYMIQYRDLLNSLVSVFTGQEMEKNPSATVVIPKELLSTSKNDLSEVQEAKINRMLSKIRSTIYNKRILIKHDFMDFDRANKGTNSTHISIPRFCRALDNLGLRFSPQDYELLARKYDDTHTNEVNFRMFIQDVDWDKQDQDISVPLYRKQSSSKSQVDLESVIDFIQHKVMRNRIRLKPFFADYDELRCGIVSPTQFRSALSSATIMLSNDQFDVLKDQYAQDLGMNYFLFCDEVDEIFTSTQLERDPRKTLKDTASFLNKHKFTRTKDASLSPLLSRLQHVVKTRGILLKPFFREFDYHARGKITKPQFKQCCDKVLPVTDSEMDTLVSAYYNPSTDYVEYLQFIDDLDPEETRTITKLTDDDAALIASNKIMSTRILNDNFTSEESDLLENIQSQAKRSRIRLKDALQDFDPLRKKRITKNKFCSVMSTLKFELSPSQLSLLCDMYMDSSSPINEICYQEFVDDVDLVFTTSGLEKNPTLQTTMFSPKDRFARTFKTLGRQTAIFKRAFKKIVYATETQSILLKPHFADYDPVHKNRISKTQFMAACDILKLHLTERELNHICDEYDDERGDIDYLSFVRDVEKACKERPSANPFVG